MPKNYGKAIERRNVRQTFGAKEITSWTFLKTCKEQDVLDRQGKLTQDKLRPLTTHPIDKIRDKPNRKNIFFITKDTYNHRCDMTLYAKCVPICSKCFTDSIQKVRLVICFILTKLHIVFYKHYNPEYMSCLDVINFFLANSVCHCE